MVNVPLPALSIVVLLSVVGICAAPSVPVVILSASRLGMSDATKLNRAESIVPVVILSASRLGMSDAAKLNLAEGTVPLPRLSAFKLVRPDPLPENVDAVTVLVTARVSQYPFAHRVFCDVNIAPQPSSFFMRSPPPFPPTNVGFGSYVPVPYSVSG